MRDQRIQINYFLQKDSVSEASKIDTNRASDLQHKPFLNQVHFGSSAAADSLSVVSCLSQRPSVAASSLMLHDYNGKKSKIIQTCRQIDEGSIGVIKVPIMQNLLNCLDVNLSQADMSECLHHLGLTFEGMQFVRYEPMIRLLQYDNHNECWTLKTSATLSVIEEGKKSNTDLSKRLMLRKSPDKKH